MEINQNSKNTYTIEVVTKQFEQEIQFQPTKISKNVYTIEVTKQWEQEIQFPIRQKNMYAMEAYQCSES